MKITRIHPKGKWVQFDDDNSDEQQTDYYEKQTQKRWTLTKYGCVFNLILIIVMTILFLIVGI
jgi:hypothetical protein